MRRIAVHISVIALLFHDLVPAFAVELPEQRLNPTEPVEVLAGTPALRDVSEPAARLSDFRSIATPSLALNGLGLQIPTLGVVAVQHAPAALLHSPASKAGPIGWGKVGRILAPILAAQERLLKRLGRSAAHEAAGQREAGNGFDDFQDSEMEPTNSALLNEVMPRLARALEMSLSAPERMEVEHPKGWGTYFKTNAKNLKFVRTNEPRIRTFLQRSESFQTPGPPSVDIETWPSSWSLKRGQDASIDASFSVLSRLVESLDGLDIEQISALPESRVAKISRSLWNDAVEAQPRTPERLFIGLAADAIAPWVPLLPGGDQIGSAAPKILPSGTQWSGDCQMRAVYNHPLLRPVRDVLSYSGFISIGERIVGHSLYAHVSHADRNRVLQAFGFEADSSAEPNGKQALLNLLARQGALLVGDTRGWVGNDPSNHTFVLNGAEYGRLGSLLEAWQQFKRLKFRDAVRTLLKGKDWSFVVTDSNYEKPQRTTWTEMQNRSLQVDLLRLLPGNEPGSRQK